MFAKKENPKIRLKKLKLKLWHATSTGENFENLIKFMKEGAKPKIAKGYGQGTGFYVWTTLKKAIIHSEWQRQQNFDAYTGYPLLIILEEDLNPEEWDLDYEVNSYFMTNFLASHWKIFKKIPDGVIKVKGGKLSISKTELMSPCFMNNARFIRYKLVNGEQFDSPVTNDKEGIDSNTKKAEYVGSIFNYMQKHFPKVTRNFETMFFLEIAKRGTAIKYVGKKPLKIKTFKMFVEGKWLDEHESILFIMRKKGKNFFKNDGVKI